MNFESKYIAKKPDKNGIVEYTAEENETWQILFQRQMEIMPDYACQEHIDGINILNMAADRIPQITEINQSLGAATGWSIAAVNSLIPQEEFFELLANRRFPVATFIRIREELDYVQEPDIFHEIFGHCPMLTNPVFADFVQTYGQVVLDLPAEEMPLLQRLFWFTVEFGLINTRKGLRSYGGGILSSFDETQYCIDSGTPERKPFVPIDAIRTPYRIDIKQPIYFIVDEFQELYDFIHSDLPALLKQAHTLGEFEPKFIPDNTPSVHILYC